MCSRDIPHKIGRAFRTRLTRVLDAVLASVFVAGLLAGFVPLTQHLHCNLAGLDNKLSGFCNDAILQYHDNDSHLVVIDMTMRN